MKSKEELEALRQEYKELNKKLLELSNEELENITGGNEEYICSKCGKTFIASWEAIYNHDTIYCPECKQKHFPEPYIPKPILPRRV